MPERTRFHSLPPRWSRRIGLGLVLAAFLAGILVLMVDVVHRLDRLRTADSDNLQWSLAQVEVEFLLLHDTVYETELAPDAKLAPLRERVDLFYSRLATVENSDLFAPVRAQPSSQAALTRLRVFLDRMVALSDGPDAALRAALPDIVREMSALRQDVRGLTVNGLTVFAKLSDARRIGLAGTLLRLALVTLTLILTLLIAVAALSRLNRAYRLRMAENQQTRTRLETILATSLDAVLVTDCAGRILEFNGAAEQIFGYSTAEAIGRPITELIIPEHMVAEHDSAMRSYLAGGVAQMIGGGRMRLEARRKDGSTFPVEQSLASATDESGEIFIAFIRDISAQDAADRALLEARDRALAGERAKAEFLAVMSHEMRTPLNGLLGTIDLLARSRLDDRQREYVEIMEASGRLLLRHVNNVLDLSKAEAGRAKLEQVVYDLAELLEEIVASQTSLAETAGNTIALELPDPPLGPLSGDPAQLRRVVLNLVGNAVKFTEKGRITISARGLAPVSGLRQQVEIRVNDTGIGIPESDLDRVFSDFVTLDTSYRRNFEGTGLGLGIARRMVEAMGGEIGVESRPGVGSSFWVHLPLLRATAQAGRDEAGGGSARPPRSEAAREVLVVEDNRINRFVVREMLEAEGHHVTEATDGHEGVELARARRFDLILMDISMPVMDGIEATRLIRGAPDGSRNSPIVALTAHAQPEEQDGFRDAGMTDCLTKPVTRAALLRQLRALDGNVEGRAGDAEGGGMTAEIAPPARRPLIDGVHLSEMEEQMGAERLNGLIRRFLAEGDVLADDLAAHASSRQEVEAAGAEAVLARLAEALHRLAGSSSAFGAQALQCKLAEAERAARERDATGVAQRLPGVLASWVATRAALSRRIEAAESTGEAGPDA
ncbi:hybrid sensor histidine kinase/response regulator [Acidimangrovimonas pyrenivorans]|uniref:histidine kinase n=1 Tax=Acidimangrovimonas pyrenivorans TaxID=2030798 RepID=A0ABV7ABI7_9RHOB